MEALFTFGPWVSSHLGLTFLGACGAGCGLCLAVCFLWRVPDCGHACAAGRACSWWWVQGAAMAVR
jgi:hypothetical protein